MFLVTLLKITASVVDIISFLRFAFEFFSHSSLKMVFIFLSDFKINFEGLTHHAPYVKHHVFWRHPQYKKWPDQYVTNRRFPSCFEPHYDSEAKC